MIEPFAYGGAAAGSSLSDAVPGASAVVEGLPPPELRWSLKQAAGASLPYPTVPEATLPYPHGTRTLGRRRARPQSGASATSTG